MPSITTLSNGKSLTKLQNNVATIATPQMSKMPKGGYIGGILSGNLHNPAKTQLASPTAFLIHNPSGGLIGASLSQNPIPQQAPSNRPVSNGVQANFPGLGGAAPSSANTLASSQVNPSSTTQTAPIKKASSQPLAGNSTANPNAGFYGIEQAQPASASFPSSANMNAGNSYSQPSAMYTNAKPTPQAGMIQNLLDLQSKVQPEVQNVAGQIKDIRTGLSNALYQNNTQPVPIEFMTGRAQALQNQATQRESALTGYLGDLLKGYDTSAGMLGTSISASAPLAGQALGYVTPTGQPVGDTQSQGYTGLRNYSIAQNNIALGGENQKVAQVTASAIQNYRQGLDSLTKFMQANNINTQTIPGFNGPINNWLAAVGNPGAAAAFNAYINDLQNFAAALIQQGVDLTPTGTEGQMLMTNPKNLTVPQLMTLGQVLDQLGMIRYTTAQNQSNDAYSAATMPGTSFTGGLQGGYPSEAIVAPANTDVGGFNPQNTNPLQQWLMGAGIGLAGNGQALAAAAAGALAQKATSGIAKALFSM